MLNPTDSFYATYANVISPSYWDTWVQVVELGGTQGDLLVLLTVGGLYLQLHQLLLDPLHGFLLGLQGPGLPKPSTLKQHTITYKCTMSSRGAKFSWAPFKQIFWHSLLGSLISAYFGVSLGTFQFSFSISKLFLLCVNLVLMNKWMQERQTFRWSNRPCTNKKKNSSIKTMRTRSHLIPLSEDFAWTSQTSWVVPSGGYTGWLLLG